jgi:ATP-dependent DNA ligase
MPTVQTDDVKVADGWLQRAGDMGLEGVVAKKRDEPYRGGKLSWIKVKALETADLVVGGFTGRPAQAAQLATRCLRHTRGSAPRRQDARHPAGRSGRTASLLGPTRL